MQPLLITKVVFRNKNVRLAFFNKIIQTEHVSDLLILSVIQNNPFIPWINVYRIKGKGLLLNFVKVIWCLKLRLTLLSHLRLHLLCVNVLSKTLYQNSPLLLFWTQQHTGCSLYFKSATIANLIMINFTTNLKWATSLFLTNCKNMKSYF